ncbi:MULTISPECIES: MlaD family protein [Nocardia]|uniref:MlaD family protein n=1 Tax=Nocardia TaxID=1817 RepID=UPI0024548BC5|nr:MULTISPECIES: MlaD family protein [Nocardia]
MLKRLFAARGFASGAIVLALAAVAVVGYRIAQPAPPMRSYCALMPDSIGLYTGSDVTLLGLPIGRVTDIRPEGAGARVEFVIPADRHLPADVGATTLSDTLVADRKLAVVDTATSSGPNWDPARCITKTLTPKSMTETFDALGDLAEELNGGTHPDQPDLLAQGFTALDTATTGRGEQINTIIHKLGSALNSPAAAIGHLGALIDALAELAHSAANGWSDVESMLTRLTASLNTANFLVVPPLVDVFDGLREVLPAANEAIIALGGPLLRKLDAATDQLPLLNAGFGSLRDLIVMLPPLVQAFTTAADPHTGQLTLTYAPPVVAIPDAAAPQVCSAINALAPGRCTDAPGGLVHTQLVPLVLGSVGAR